MTGHVTERLSAYLDGELAAAERDEVASHLRGCDACAGHLEELAAVDALARDLPTEAPEGYFDALPGRVRARLPFRRARRAPIMPAWSWAVAAALLIAVVAPRVLQQAPRSAVAVHDELRPSEAAPPPALLAQPSSAPLAAPAPTLRDESPKRARLDAPVGREQGLVEAKAKQEAVVPEDKPAAAPVQGKDAAANGAAANRTTAKAAFAAPPPEQDLEESAQSRFHADAEPAKEQAEVEAKPAPAAAGLTTSGAAAVEERLARKTRARPAGEWYAALMTRSAKDAAEARALREEWRGFAVHYPAGTRGDEARVRVVEAGLLAFRLSNDPADKSLLRADGESYLRRDDAAQGQRVRALLDNAGN